jgi:hypothetical protein
MKHKEKKVKKRNWKKVFKKAILYTSIAGFLTYHGNQFTYDKKIIADYLYAPKEFREFKENTGINLSGFEENITNKDLITIASILNNEKLVKKELSGIIIESQNYDEKSIHGKLLEKYSFHGFANPLTNKITLKVPATNLFIHELAHIKTYSKIKLFEKTQFEKEWDEIQEKTPYKYMTFKEKREHLKSKSLTTLVKDSTENIDLELQKKLENNGYITPYARFSKYEDIAEIVESILYKAYITNNPLELKNEILKEKINLLVKYDFLPKELNEYFNLKKEFLEWRSLSWKRNVDSTLIDYEKLSRIKYIFDSEKFLIKNPNSFLKTKIIVDRATVIFFKYDASEKDLRKRSYSEMKEALMYPEKIGYLELLEKSKTLRQYHLKDKQENEYIKAINEYKEGINNLNFKIITKEFIQVLIKNKILDENYVNEKYLKDKGQKNE